MKFVIKGSYYGDKTFPSLNDYIHQLGTNPKAGGTVSKDAAGQNQKHKEKLKGNRKVPEGSQKTTGNARPN